MTGIHAREWISPSVTLQLIHKLAQEVNVTQAFDFHVVPMANPDGYVYSHTPGNRMWRKNRAKTENPNCWGVDLNRNWDHHWGVGASRNPCHETYGGPNPFSEPETRALRDAMLNVKREIVLVLAVHSHFQSLLYPWGWSKDTQAPDTPDMIAKGKIFADAAKAKYGTVYSVESSSVLGLISGATDDWAKGTLKSKYVYTLELPDKRTFHLPLDKILPTGKEIWAGLLKFLQAIVLE